MTESHSAHTGWQAANGLESSEAASRLDLVGPNAIPVKADPLHKVTIPAFLCKRQGGEVAVTAQAVYGCRADALYIVAAACVDAWLWGGLVLLP